QQVLEALGLQEFENAIGPDVRRADKENASMDAGEAMPYVNDTDDHAVHLVEHELVMKDPAFDTKPPEVQQVYKDHRKAHKEALPQLQPGLAPRRQPGGGAPTDPVVQQGQQGGMQLNPPPPPGPDGMNGGPPVAGPPPEGVQPPAM